MKNRSFDKLITKSNLLPKEAKMNRISKVIGLGLCLLIVHTAHAAAGDSGQTNQSCQPKVCPKPCPPKPCKPPCPPVCFERGYPDAQCCLPSAYNEPADYELSPCPWNFWFDASFTYWTAYEDGLDLANSVSTIPGQAGALQIPQNSNYLFQKTEWKPGFKVGMGLDLDFDHWSGYAEYTWFRSKTHTSAGLPSGAPAGSSNPAWLVRGWDLGQRNGNTLVLNQLDAIGTQASTINSSWRTNIDLLDAAVTRPYYQGTHLIIAPFGGFRATWIRQKLRMAIAPFSTVTATATANAVFHNKSNSWAVGPRAGFGGQWHLGWGFRFEGDCAGSIAFTRYTKVASSADPVILAVRNTRSARWTDLNTIRFNNDMNFGLGWGSYFDCRNYHFDLLATYDFQIFWNQNMLRKLTDATSTGVSGASNNLYLQGLTMKAQFDF